MIILINLWPNLPCENISGMLENVGYFDLPPHTPFDFGDPSSQIGFLVVSDDFKKKSFNIKKFGLGFFSCHFWRRTVWACTWRHFRFQGMNLSVWSLPDKQCYCFACEIGYGGGDVSFAKRSSGGKLATLLGKLLPLMNDTSACPVLNTEPFNPAERALIKLHGCARWVSQTQNIIFSIFLVFTGYNNRSNENWE